MTEEPTPEEIARCKRWAAMQSTPVTVTPMEKYPDKWKIRDLPDWVGDGHLEGGELRSVWALEKFAWEHLALALRPVFDSVGPVIREDFRQSACDALLKEMQAAGLKNDRWDAGYRKACENCAVIVEGLE